MDSKYFIGGALIGIVFYYAWKDDNTSYYVNEGDGGNDSIPSTVDNFVSAIMGTPTRGERNNNPGNIRHGSSEWQGMSAVQSDPSFVQFDDAAYGIRALGVLLRNYYAQGYNTVRRIINRYAPASENNTSSYVTHVSNLIGATPDMQLNLADDNTLHALVSAIIQHENGRNIYADNGQLDAGISMLA